MYSNSPRTLNVTEEYYSTAQSTRVSTLSLSSKLLLFKNYINYKNYK